MISSKVKAYSSFVDLVQVQAYLDRVKPKTLNDLESEVKIRTDRDFARKVLMENDINVPRYIFFLQ